MKQRYKLIISNKFLYKEVELSPDIKGIKVGTSINCDVRLRKELFFDEFEIQFENISGSWQAACSNNMYFYVGDIRKLLTKQLKHGDEFILKYQNNDNEAIKIIYIMDFEYERKDFRKAIDIRNLDEIYIGGRTFDNSITIQSELAETENVLFKRVNDGYSITAIETAVGIFINGVLAKGTTVIKDMDFFSIADTTFYYNKGLLYFSEKSNVVTKELNIILVEEKTKYPLFNRNTRLMTELNKEKIEILDPPSIPQKPKGNIIMQLLPAIMMLALTVVVRGFMSGSNGSFIIFSVCSMAMGIITSTISIVSDRKKYRKSVTEREEKYNSYIKGKIEQIQNYRSDEENKLSDIYISPEKELEYVETFSGELFDRTNEDEDFLKIRLGVGTKKAEREISYKKQEKFASEDPLASVPEETYKKYKNLTNAPIVADAKRDNVIGIVGEKDNNYSLIKNMVLDLCVRHYYKDLRIFFLINSNEKGKFSWIKWIPHVQNEDINMRNIVSDEHSKNTIFEYLYVEFGRRQQIKEKKNTHFIIFILDDWGIKTHPVSQYISNASENNATFIFSEDVKSELPLGCDELVYTENDNSGYIISSAKKDSKFHFTYNSVSDEQLNRVALKLAPVICEEVSLENALTKNITLYELFNILSADDIDLEKRWNNSVIYKSMAAPLGVKTKDEIIYLDLHEKAHGPHGLVAGTTGSGKSEILQTYILSMATLFHPYEVGFVIIDFKGGGMVNQFKDLPHLIGAITNIDGREINRSLLSIKAELQKRQRIFAESGVNNINNYTKLYKAKEVTIPVPHLILVVDEFAELKAEQPEFMKELISAARIGRSLGVHLILATQKPSGQVNEQIWSNSKFKLCLKVQNKEDSNEVLKSPLAAEIKEAGRAYLQVGNNEIFELFQSAYSGAPANSDEKNNVKEFSVAQVSFEGKRNVVFTQKNSKSDNVVETQLEAIVKSVRDFCEKKNIQRLPNICMPPLEDIINYPIEKEEINDMGITSKLGIYDDPNNQLQEETSIDFTEGNVVIIGSSQYGKTNLLQLMIRSLADKYSPNEVSMYVLDFGSMALKIFEGLNHIGGVVLASDDEKVKNFFRMIKGEIKDRKEKFSQMGITSYASYREAGYKDIPQNIIFIDNFLAFKELYVEYEDDMINICREGNSVGVCVVITSQQTSGISYKYMSNFPTRICLYCNQGDEYGTMFDRCRMEPKNVPGRGLIEIDKNVYEYQSYLAFEGEREIDRVGEIQTFITNKNEIYDGMKAKKIPEVPKLLDSRYVMENWRKYGSPYEEVPIGIDYETVEFTTLNLLKASTIGITGRKASGKTNLLELIMKHCQNNVFDFPVKAYLIDDYERQLQKFSHFGFVEKYTIDIADIEMIFEEFENELIERKEKVQDYGYDSLKDEPLLMFVVQNEGIYSSENISKRTAELYKKIISQYRQFKVLFIFANVMDVNIAYNSPEMLKNMKEIDFMFVFDDVTNSKMLDVNASTARKYKKAIELGDAYMALNDGTITKLKTVLSEERD